MSTNNKKQALRSKTRPSNSAKAASLLNGGAGTGFIGFGSGGFSGGFSGGLNAVSGIASSAAEECNADSDLQLAFKKLTKRDATTKLRALTDLSSLLKEKSTDIVELYLPSWTKAYLRLSVDYDWKVRAATQTVFLTMIEIVKKKLATQLKYLMGQWLCSQFDPSKEVSSSSSTTFRKTFPENKSVEVLLFTKREVLNFLKDNLAQTVQTLNNMKEVTPTEANEKYERVIYSSILAFAHLVRTLPEKENQQLQEEYETIVDIRFWKSMFASNSDLIRRATYLLSATLSNHFPILLSGNQTTLAPLVWGLFGEKKAINHGAMWEAILSYGKAFPESWKHTNLQKHVLPRFFAFLRAGCYGSPTVSYPSLLPFLSITPSQTEWFEEFFNSLWQGREAEKADRQTAPIEALLSGYLECFMYFFFSFVKCSLEGDKDSSTRIDHLQRLFFLQVLDLLLCEETPICPVHVLVTRTSGAIAKIIQKLVSLGGPQELSNFLDGIATKAEAPLASDLESLRQSGDSDSALFSHETFSNRLAQLLGQIKQDLSESSTPSANDVLLKLARKIAGLALPKARLGGSHQLNILTKLTEGFGIEVLFSSSNKGKEKEDECESEETSTYSPSTIFSCLFSPWVEDQLKSGFSSLFHSSQLFSILRSYLHWREREDSRLFSSEWQSLVSLVAQPISSDYLFTLLDRVCTAPTDRWHCEHLDTTAEVRATRLLVLDKPGEYSLRDRRLVLSDRRFLALALSGPEGVSSSLVSAKVVVRVAELIKDQLKFIVSEGALLPQGKKVLPFMSTIQQLADVSEILNKLFSAASWASTICSSLASDILSALFEITLTFASLSKPYFFLDENGEKIKFTTSQLAKAVDSELFLPSSGSKKLPIVWARQITSTFPLLAVQVSRELSLKLLQLVKKKIVAGSFNYDEELLVDFVAGLLLSFGDSQSISAALDTLLFVDPGSWSKWKSWVNYVKMLNFLTLDLPAWVPSPPPSTPKQLNMIDKYGRVLLFTFTLASRLGFETVFQRTDSENGVRWELIQELICSCILARDTDYKMVDLSSDKKHWERFITKQLSFYQKGLLPFLRSLTKDKLHNSGKLVSTLFSSSLNMKGPIGGGLVTTMALKEVLSTVLEPVSAAPIVFGIVKQKPYDQFLLEEPSLLTLQAAVSSASESLSEDLVLFFNWACENLNSLALTAESEVTMRRIVDILSSLLRSAGVSSLKEKGITNPIAAALRSRLGESSGLVRGVDEHISLNNSFAKLLYYTVPSMQKSEVLSDSSFYFNLLLKWSSIQDNSAEGLSLLYYSLRLFRRLSNIFDGENSVATQWSAVKKTLYTILLARFFAPDPWESPASFTYSDDLASAISLFHDAPLPPASSALEDEEKITQLYERIVHSPLTNQQKASYVLLNSVIKKRNQILLEQSNQADEIQDEEDTSRSSEILISSQLRTILEGFDLTPNEEPHVTFGYFLAWALVLEYLAVKVSVLRNEFIDYLKDAKVTSRMLQCFFRHIEEDAHELEFVDLPIQDVLAMEDIDTSSSSLSSLASSLYFRTLKTLPAIVRSWWSSSDRHTSLKVDKYTTEFVSPLIIQQEVGSVLNYPKKPLDDYTIKAQLSSSEVTATYVKDELSITMSIRIPPSYPLRLVEVECNQKIGVSEAQLRKWLLAITTLLMTKNGSILDGLLLWKESLDKHFEGVEPCPICYSVFHLSNNQLPKLQCKTCKNKFHAACMYKWINTSQGKSSCPMCRTPFNVA